MMRAMDQYPRAKRLTEVAAAVDLAPLESGDPRYVDISAGRGTDQLSSCASADGSRCAAEPLRQIAFTAIAAAASRRNCCDWSTRLRTDSRRCTFTPKSPPGDYDYTDLFLWFVDELVRKFEARWDAAGPQVAEDVALWFAEVTLEEVDEVK
jgi:hypothetical protein